MATVKRRLPDGPTKKKAKTTPVEVDEKLSLPAERSEPVADIDQYMLFLFGEKKIGKTLLASKFPHAFFMMTEPGGKALAIYQRPVRRWREFTAYVKLLEKDRRFRTTVVDIVDRLYDMCERHVCDKLGIDHPSEEDWGKGYAAVRKEFNTWITRLISIPGKGTIFISHAEERKIKRGRSGPEYDRVVTTMPRTPREIIEGLADMWFYYTYDGDRRVLILEGDEHVSAGHRLTDRFRWGGKPVTEITMSPSPDVGFKNFMAAFNNQYQPPRTADDEPATVKPLKKKKRVA